ncbi:Serine/threonine-protein kinase Tel1 [Candida albicans]
MSTSDINKTIALLQSSKIKERNDALNNLENIAASKFRLNPKQFRQLTQAILALIKHESQIYFNNKSTTVDSRLSQASYNLRLLTEKSIEDTRIDFKYRTYLDLCMGIKDQFFVHSELLEPCSIDFIKTITSILNLSYVKEHLNRKEWSILYIFLVSLINNILDDCEGSFSNNGNNEKLLIDLYTALQNLLQCESSVSINYLQLYDNDNYFKLLRILDKTSELLKKENVIIIIIFRIINKLITVIATEKFKFVNKLIKIGIRLMVYFHHSHWEKLQEQFLIFINLPGTHDLINLHNLPKLIGDRYILSEISTQEDGDSINSQADNQDEVFLYNLGVLIHHLMKKLMSGSFELKTEDIGMCTFNNSITWFNLKTIYSDSQNYKPWLLTLGVSRLLKSYYDLKQFINKQSNDPQTSLLLYSNGSPNKNKRQKLGSIADTISDSNSAIELCNKLIHSKESSDNQVLGLKLLTFYLELYTFEKPKEQSTESDSMDTTIGENTTFDFVISTTDNTFIDKNVVMKNILITFDDNSMNFWSSLCARSVLLDEILQSNHGGFKFKKSFSIQLLKLSLLLLKEPEVANIACNIIFKLVFEQKTNLSELIDDSVIIQLETLIDLSEINGPYKITEESFQFWYAINKLAIEVNLSKKNFLGRRIQDWMLAKWDITFSPGADFVSVGSSLANFIYWLSGNSISYSPTTTQKSTYEGDIYEFYYFAQSYDSLEKFLCLKSVSDSSETIKFDIISIASSDRIDAILNKVNSTFMVFDRSSVTSGSLFCWIIVLSNIVAKVRSMKFVTHELTGLQFQLSAGLNSFKDITLSCEEIIDVMEMVNKFLPTDPDTIQIFIQNFPSEKLVNIIKFDYPGLADKDNRKSVPEDGFGWEFSRVRDATTPPSTTSTSTISLAKLNYKKIQSLEVSKFIMFTADIEGKLQSDILTAFLNYVETLESDDFLPSLLFVVENIFTDHSAHFIDEIQLAKLLRIINEKLLSTQNYEKNEFVLVVISRFLSATAQVWINSSDNSLASDFYSLVSRLYSSGRDDLILTETSIVEYCRFLAHFIAHNDERVLSNTDIKNELLEKFSKSPNNIKDRLANSFGELVSLSTVQQQGQIYSDLFDRFVNPEQSVESAGTYTKFFTNLSQSSLHILRLALFNLLECSRFSFFIPYLEICLKEFCMIMKLDNANKLFKIFKFEILRNWWKYDSIDAFPFVLFSYTDLSSFYRDNYRELIAVALSTKSRSPEISNAFVEQLADLKQSHSETLVAESLSIIVPLSYSKDGVRNDVFQILLDYLKNSFKQEFIDKLPLIVLEIIKFTEISNEKSFESLGTDGLVTMLLNDTGFSSTIQTAGEMVISFDSSVQLLKKLVEKYHQPEHETFWSSRQIYFLIRRLSISLKLATTFEQKVIFLRKFKFVLVLGGKKSIDYAVSRLLVDTLCPLLSNEPKMSADVFLILQSLTDVYSHRYTYDKSISLIIQIINSLLETEAVDRSRALLDCIDDFVNTGDQDRAICQLLKSSVAILKGQAVEIESSLIELCLEESGPDYIKQMILISRIFGNVVFATTHSGSKLPVVEKLLALSKNQIQEFSDGYKLWIANYLSDFYIEGGCKEQIKALTFDEYEGIPVNDFENEVRSFDFTLKSIEQYIYKDDFEAAACAESIIGVLIRKYETSKREVSKFLNFETTLEKHSDSILPIDFHTCVILNDKADVEYLGDELIDIINNFESFLSNGTELWCTKLYLALLQELAVETNIAPLLSTFVIMVPEFAKTSLPVLVCNYLAIKRTHSQDRIISLLNEFLHTSKKSESSIKVFLQILILIRVGAKIFKKPVFANVFAKIDKLKFYQLACEVKQFKTALMLFEDVASDTNSDVHLQDHYQTLQHVYESLDDDDLVFGLPERTTLEYSISMINRVGNSDDRLRFSSASFDTDMMLNQEPSYSNIVGSLSAAGLLGVSRALSKNTSFASNDDSQYEWSWKLSKWDLPISKNATKENEVIYKTLKQIHDFPMNSQDICSSSLLNAVDNKVSATNMSVKEFKQEGINWLKTISTVASIAEIANATGDNIIPMTNQFSEKTEWFGEVEFSMFENLLLARQTTFGLINDRPISSLPSDTAWMGALCDLVRYNNLARTNGEYQKMVTSTMLVDVVSKKLQSSSLDMVAFNANNLASFQTAQTLWCQGNTNVPVMIMKDLYAAGGIDMSENILKVDKCLIRAMMVDWMSQSRQEVASSIMEKYVMPTEELSNHMIDLQQQSKIFSILARFCEEQYKFKSLSEKISKLEKRVLNKENEIKDLKKQYEKVTVTHAEQKQVQQYYNRLKKQFVSESKDLESLRKSKQLFSSKAVQYYMKSIIVDDFEEENLDKFFSLWLEQSGNNELNQSIQSNLLALPSYKLVSWCTQLISRLSNETNNFQILLKKLIINMCLDHPHHSLYLLLSLKKHKPNTNEVLNPSLLSRCAAAQAIWDQLLLQDHRYISDVLLPIDGFTDQCITLAAYKVSKGKSIDLTKFSAGDYWLNELPAIPPPTETIRVDPSKQYKNVPVLHSIDKKISIATSGLSLPKVANFILSNGTEHRVLLKHGTDGIRQDSIMEQVFNKVNNIFAKDRECNKRGLTIRTYNAVPLGPLSGIIEFVPNSMAFIDVISGYHQMHDKISYDKAREMMKSCQSGDKQKRIHSFEQIEAKIKPVMRYFFQETFLTSDSWFESRVKYTHGIATSSIVGHILGLGDRHCNNILIDRSTGEPIHIDLGVAFDQGKRLAIPETVPFRLTRDIVDGFGVTGVEGMFKKSCEHTLRVLRTNKEHIISILDVLRWDPLYSWTLSRFKKRKLQEDETGPGVQPEEEGSEAGTAIMTVIEKLNANGLSTEAAVREFIQEATSTQNLALIYFGWSPFY